MAKLGWFRNYFPSGSGNCEDTRWQDLEKAEKKRHTPTNSNLIWTAGQRRMAYVPLLQKARGVL